MNVPYGKQAMVWKLRNWMGGDPAQQVQEAQRLGLKRVSIKVTDGKVERWESGSRTNKDLLPATTLALQAAGIEVDGWAWMKGRAWQWDWDKGRYVYCTPMGEAVAAVEVCHRLHIEHLQADAEASYMDRSAWASEWCYEANRIGPDIFMSLCSYRFPLTMQPKFPVRVFAPYMAGWSPQVYFLGDNRTLGGAVQLEESVRQYNSIRLLPYIGVAPTYQAAGPWRASYSQLLAFGQRAMLLGLAGVSFWALDLASPLQLQAIEEITWSELPPVGDDMWKLLVASNLRTGPGIAFPVIRLLQAGTLFERADSGLGNGGDWWSIIVDGAAGFIWAPAYKVQFVG